MKKGVLFNEAFAFDCEKWDEVYQKIHLVHALAAVTELGQCLCIAAALVHFVTLLILVFVEDGPRDKVGS